MLATELQVPGGSRGRCRVALGTKGSIKVLGWEGSLVAPHSRLEADRGLHPVPAQRLPEALDLGHQS